MLRTSQARILSHSIVGSFLLKHTYTSIFTNTIRTPETNLKEKESLKNFVKSSIEEASESGLLFQEAIRRLVYSGDYDTPLYTVENAFKKGLTPSSRLLSMLINACVDNRRVDLAEKVHELITTSTLKPDTELWSAIIKIDNPLSILKRIRELGCEPNPTIYREIIRSCATDLPSKHFQKLVNLIKNDDTKLDFETYNLIINCYASKGLTEEAFDLLEELHEVMNIPSSTCYNELYEQFLAVGDKVKAKKILHMMVEDHSKLNDKTYNTMVKMHVIERNIQKAFISIEEMKKAGYEIDISTVKEILKACHTLEENDVISILDYIHQTQVTFDSEGWTLFIDANLQIKRIDEAKLLFKEMEESGHEPDFINYVNIILVSYTIGDEKTATLFYEKLLKRKLIESADDWNMILSVTIKSANIKIIMGVLNDFRESEHKPDRSSYRMLLETSLHLNDKSMARGVLSSMSKDEITDDGIWTLVEKSKVLSRLI
ncbi:pentatricopeptide repeat-containing protein [Acrasis kona]|uniref:Pentatricopeptide repeat-containing protein n=1 Tax=Acrasis kona TaxID=1008807 RepID=A0AAW2ZD84_9EUKA